MDTGSPDDAVVAGGISAADSAQLGTAATTTMVIDIAQIVVSTGKGFDNSLDISSGDLEVLCRSLLAERAAKGTP